MCSCSFGSATDTSTCMIRNEINVEESCFEVTRHPPRAPRSTAKPRDTHALTRHFSHPKSHTRYDTRRRLLRPHATSSLPPSLSVSMSFLFSYNRLGEGPVRPKISSALATSPRKAVDSASSQPTRLRAALFASTIGRAAAAAVALRLLVEEAAEFAPSPPLDCAAAVPLEPDR